MAIFDVYISINGYDYNMLVNAWNRAQAQKVAVKHLEMVIRVTPFDDLDDEMKEDLASELAQAQKAPRTVVVYSEGT